MNSGQVFYTGVCGEHAGVGETAGCGEFYSLTAQSVTVIQWGGANRHWEWQVFGQCPHCGNTVLGHYCESSNTGRKPGQVVDLVKAGAGFTWFRRSAELDEPARSRPWPPFTVEDMLIAHRLLEDDEWAASVVDVLAKKYGSQP